MAFFFVAWWYNMFFRSVRKYVFSISRGETDDRLLIVGPAPQLLSLSCCQAHLHIGNEIRIVIGWSDEKLFLRFSGKREFWRVGLVFFSLDFFWVKSHQRVELRW
jgi:hypothetical protein